MTLIPPRLCQRDCGEFGWDAKEVSQPCQDPQVVVFCERQERSVVSPSFGPDLDTVCVWGEDSCWLVAVLLFPRRFAGTVQACIKHLDQRRQDGAYWRVAWPGYTIIKVQSSTLIFMHPTHHCSIIWYFQKSHIMFKPDRKCPIISLKYSSCYGLTSV